MRGTRELFFGALLCLLASVAAGAAETVQPLAQADRPAPSVPLGDLDVKLGNANWMGGMLAASQWMWSGNLIPQAFDNNLGKFFLHLPSVLEVQLPYSTTLIFDEPSFRNGHQMSGFIDRVTRELVISYLGQSRRAWYTMTHHAILGTLTARKHGLDDAAIAAKWSNLLDYRSKRDVYSPLEQAALRFAEAFSSNPKSYTDADYQALRAALREDNRRRWAKDGAWMDRLTAAREAEAYALARGLDSAAARAEGKRASEQAVALGDEANERMVDRQTVELALVCLQFVALTDVFSSLNIPDEAGVADLMKSTVPGDVIRRINELNAKGGEGLGSLVPPPVALPLQQIRSGTVRVDPILLRGTRVPLVSWETDPSLGTRDKGVAVGGVHTGVFGWAGGAYFPGGLGFMILNHPEQARTEPPYSLSLLFNEDEWRNGVNTSGFVDRLLKEFVIQCVYRLTRNRYGLEHHTMFLLNEYLRVYGVNPRHPKLSDSEAQEARGRAIAAFQEAVFALSDPERKAGRLSELERSVATWTTAIVTQPHLAYRSEPALRAALDRENRSQVAAGTRRLDQSPGLDKEAAFRRLLDQQIAELAMMVGHMDGLGRAFSMLHTEGEATVQIAEGELTPDLRLRPKLDAEGHLKPTGYFNTRPGIVEVLTAIGVPADVLTVNEMLLNPRVSEDIRRKLDAGQASVHVAAGDALETGEF